ncbi:hybrid sensor histidine kinase/response regulator [Phormidesmis priestleyi]
MVTPTSESILVVDDNPTNLSVLKQALNGAGWKVRLEMDGEGAIEQAKLVLPALILLDIQMPGIDGFETCRRLKADPLTQEIPIIFMTALTDTESKVKGLLLGAVDYITKPFEQAEVIARVRVHLRLRQLTDTLEQQVEERTAALRSAQVQLVQQEKLATLGQLVAGVAHEINNPMSFIVCNVAPARQYVQDLAQFIKIYQQVYQQMPPVPQLQQAFEDLDVEFAIEDLAKLLGSMELGAERIQEISNSLRNFSRLDSDQVTSTNLHENIESVLVILRHRFKPIGDRPEIKIIKQYDSIPSVDCYSGPINQVLMNLLSNAVDALEAQSDPKIWITTELQADNAVVLRISDNGSGMNETVQQQVFEPLFTTKPPGRGTGLGLSIARQIIEEKHEGKLHCVSTLGKGTEFSIELPLTHLAPEMRRSRLN